MSYTLVDYARLRDEFAIAFIMRATAGESFENRAKAAYAQADECLKARSIVVDPVVEFAKAVEKVVQEATGKSPTDALRAEWLEKAKIATADPIPYTILPDNPSKADIRLAAIRTMLKASGGAEGILACINVGNPAPLSNLVYEIVKGAE